MSKYDPLWRHLQALDADALVLSFDQIEAVLGFPIDHSFLNFKKELPQYGWAVGKISLKGQTVAFVRQP